MLCFLVQFIPNTKDPNVWLRIRERPEQSILRLTTPEIKYPAVCDARVDKIT